MKTPQEHIYGLFNEYTRHASYDNRSNIRFTSRSNKIIQTALSGQNKFLFEILQNADDSCDDEHIEVAFYLVENFLVVNHTGKGFEYDDVERICDYASEIQRVKANDLSKTGYKGLGFKSLFNISNCIYIYSNGYSFRFDKTHWRDWARRPWQFIPIWCTGLPLHQIYRFDKPVNFILKVNNVNQLQIQLQDLVDRPELLLYLNHITKLGVNFNNIKHFLDKRIEEFGVFKKVDIYDTENTLSTWLLRTYTEPVPNDIRKAINENIRFICPDKIKSAKEVPFTYALRTNDVVEEISKIKGLCHNTLPTQLYLTVHYHIDSYFILNRDRTELLENEWNTFLIYRLGYLQFSLLKDLAEVPYLKNYVIELLVRDFPIFNKAFSKGFNEAQREIAWLPSQEGSRLLKLGEAWIDETDFFKQNFHKVRDEEICSHLIDYDVKWQCNLRADEVKRFGFFNLFDKFPSEYCPQLTKKAYVKFISYLYESLKNGSPVVLSRLRTLRFLVGKEKKLLCPIDAILDETENPIPDFAELNPVNNDFLPSENIGSIKEWLIQLGAKRLTSPIEILRESILKLLNSEDIKSRINIKNHVQIINYLAENIDQLSAEETKKLQSKFVILTKINKFELANSCYFHDAVPVKELSDVISDSEKISSCYDVDFVKEFFIRMGVKDKLSPLEVFRRIILKWIRSGYIQQKLTRDNYAAIIEYMSECYPSLEKSLTDEEKLRLKDMRVLTLDNKFRTAHTCFFESAVPSVKCFETVIAKDELVSRQNISNNLYEFLKKIGVSEEILPRDVLKRSVIKWVNEDQIQSRITLDNHKDILSFIADHWDTLRYCLGENDIQALKKIHILTESNTLRAACKCYWPPDENFCENIPGLKSVIPPNEFASLDYPDKIEKVLKQLGVRNLQFTDIYIKYCNHLNRPENVKWFFDHISDYWNRYKSTNNILLTYLQSKFKASRSLLAKNGKMHSSMDLYSPKFYTMHSVDPDSVPLLNYDNLPRDLEEWLGFKEQLELKCIVRLLDSLRKNPNIGKEKTRTFFVTLLEQLKQKAKDEIKKHTLSLLSEDNKVKPAKELNYFKEEYATCYLKPYYLKRIHGMSHENTLELAELCGVNILPYTYEVKFGQGEKTCDESLKDFYLKRLHLIALQESRKLNESPISVLKDLFNKICSIELYRCPGIFIQYPFGNPHGVRNHMKGLKMYATGNWNGFRKMDFHNHLKVELGFETDVKHIIHMDVTAEYVEEWLSDRNESPEALRSIEKELQDLLFTKQNPCPKEKIDESHDEDDLKIEVSNSDHSSFDESSSDEYPSDVVDSDDESALPSGYVFGGQENKNVCDDWPANMDSSFAKQFADSEAESDWDNWMKDYMRSESS